MFKWLESRVLWGSLLILAGVVFLLQNIIGFPIGGVFWGILFGIAGLVFVWVFISNKQQWWAVIPGFSLLGIGFTILVSSLLPRVGDFISGTVILGGIALGFLVVYLVDRNNWWALIPGGVLLTLAVVAGLDNFISGEGVGAIFFLGMGLTFVLIALLPGTEGKMRWAWIPAGVLIFMSFVVMAAAGQIFGYIWPIALIGVGVFFVFRALFSGKK